MKYRKALIGGGEKGSKYCMQFERRFFSAYLSQDAKTEII